MPSRRSPTLPSSARRAAPPPSPCFPLCKGSCSRTTRLGADMTLRRRAGGRRLRRSWRHGSPRMSISRPHRHRAPRRRRRPRLLLQSVRRRQACAVHHDDQLFAHHAIRCEIGGPHREGLRCRMHLFGSRTDCRTDQKRKRESPGQSPRMGISCRISSKHWQKQGTIHALITLKK